jgi:tRNA1(Val) A37 N6-methylase TrmN6
MVNYASLGNYEINHQKSIDKIVINPPQKSNKSHVFQKIHHKSTQKNENIISMFSFFCLRPNGEKIYGTRAKSICNSAV